MLCAKSKAICKRNLRVSRSAPNSSVDFIATPSSFFFQTMRRDFFICLLLAGITLGLYWPARQFDLIYFDDPLFVTENVQINGGLNMHSPGLGQHWHRGGKLASINKPCLSAYTPIFGENIGVEHLLNIFIHAANAVLLFVLLRRMTGSSWRSAMVAAFFAWHPLRVESVAWIAERKDVLCAFFWLLSLIAYSNLPRYKNNLSPRIAYPNADIYCRWLFSHWHY